MRNVLWLCGLVPAIRPSVAPADLDTASLDVNRWRMCITNFGVFGHDVRRSTAGGEWPGGTGHMYVYGAGLWIGALVGDTYTVVGYNPNSGHWEHTPGDSVGGVNDSLVRIYRYPDRWPAPQSRFPHAPQDVRSDQDAWRCFNDFDTTFHEPGNHPRRSLGIQVYETDYASAGYLVRDFIYLRYEIENQRSDSLKDVYLGIAMDPDIGNANDDYCRMYYHHGFVRGPGDTVYCDNLACAFSEPQVGWDTTGTVAVELIRTPGNRGASAMKVFTFGTGPVGDQKQYLALAGYNWWLNPPVYDPVDSLDSTPNDKQFLVSTGPFDLAPGQSESLVAVVLAVNTDPNVDPLRIAEAAWRAESIYFAGPHIGIETPDRPIVSEAPVELLAVPNPFTDQLKLRLSGPARSTGHIEIRDVTGRLVQVIPFLSGVSTYLWDGRDRSRDRVPSGVYFIRAGNYAAKVIRKD